MKNSTLLGRSKSLKVSAEVGNAVRNGLTYLIKPLTSKTSLELDGYYYFKEYDEATNSYTTKETAHTYIKVLSNKVVNVQDITDEDFACLGLSERKDFVEYYNRIIADMSNELSKSAKNKLIKNYSYISNPCIEFVEFEIIDPANPN